MPENMTCEEDITKTKEKNVEQNIDNMFMEDMAFEDEPSKIYSKILAQGT